MTIVTTAQRIRDWLATQDGPRTAGEIRIALGLDAEACRDNLYNMANGGLLLKAGKPRSYVYSLGRPPARVFLCESDAERRERIRASDRKRSARKCEHRRAKTAARRAAMPPKPPKAHKPRGEQQAQRAAKRTVTRELKAIAQQTRMRQMEDARVERIRALKAAVGVGVARPVVVEAPAETLEQFLARGGAVERLSPGAVSESNQLKGWRLLHEQERRSAA